VVDTEERSRRRDLMTAPMAPVANASNRQGLLLVALNVSWAMVMARFGRGDIYWVVGVHALLVTAVVVALRGSMLRESLRVRPRDVVLGVAVGILMTAATYAIFEMARVLMPSLSAHVARLYRAAGTSTPGIALAWTLAILTGEELLWRGAWIDVWGARWGVPAAAVSSVVAFSLTQLGSGSLIVALLACVCGLVWTFLRLHTGRLVASLVAHAIWTPVVILWWPVL
jgi:membrane protease YdiL (CAAX protease family)